MPNRQFHVVEVLIRRQSPSGVEFLLYPYEQWLTSDGKPHLSLPTKKTVRNLPEPFLRGTSLEYFVDEVMRNELGAAENDYVLEQEIDPVECSMVSPQERIPTDYVVYPVNVWLAPEAQDVLKDRMRGQWLTAAQAMMLPNLSPTARAIFDLILKREDRLNTIYSTEPAKEHAPEAQRRLLRDVPQRPSMDALAKKWFSRNKTGVRVLGQDMLNSILDTGNRAFNLRVADPYLRYQLQGLGFTWSFFTHKDKQDTHTHGAPTVEIYGVLEGEMEIWWKPYYDRGTSAWNHRILKAGDWAEVESLQCHIVHWLGQGKGVVFKAGPGPLAEVGKLGVKGKTPCDTCPCMKPKEVKQIEEINKLCQ